MQLVYKVILLNKILRNHLLSKNMQWNDAYHSMLPLIISCTGSWKSAWHLLWHLTTESKNIVKLLAISQTIHTVTCCCEDDYFQKEKFKYYYLIVCFTQWTLFFQEVCFLLPICLPCVICRSYMHEIMECCVTSSLALDNWAHKYCQTLGNKPYHSHHVLQGQLFSTGKI